MCTSSRHRQGDGPQSDDGTADVDGGRTGTPMPQDIADNFHRSTRLDLACGVCMAQDVRSEEWSADARARRVLPERVTNRRTAQGTMRKRVAHENGATTSVGGALAPDVSSERTRHWVEERKHGGAPRLRPADPNRTCDPIQVFERQPGYLGGAHAVGRHHEEYREVAPSWGPSYIDRTQDPTDVAPRESAPGAIDRSNPWCHHAGGKVEA